MRKALGHRLQHLSVIYDTGGPWSNDGLAPPDELTAQILSHCPLLETLQLRAVGEWHGDTAEVPCIESCQTPRSKRGAVQPSVSVRCVEVGVVCKRCALQANGVPAAGTGLCAIGTLHQAVPVLPGTCSGMLAAA